MGKKQRLFCYIYSSDTFSQSPTAHNIQNTPYRSPATALFPKPPITPPYYLALIISLLSHPGYGSPALIAHPPPTTMMTRTDPQTALGTCLMGWRAPHSRQPQQQPVGGGPQTVMLSSSPLAEVSAAHGPWLWCLSQQQGKVLLLFGGVTSGTALLPLLPGLHRNQAAWQHFQPPHNGQGGWCMTMVDAARC